MHFLSSLGRLQNAPDSSYSRALTISTNSNIKADIFIPLRGEKFDGHDFIKDAIENGSGLVACSEEYYNKNTDKLKGTPLLIVPDTLAAYQRIALWHRRLFNIPFIAITGSSGKTTLKEMLALLFEGSLKTYANENNDIGVAKTLLNINDTHSAGIIEMGMRGSGEIKRLVEIIEPDVAVITNVSYAHLGQFPNFDALINAKKEAFDYSKGLCVMIGNDNTEKLSRNIDRSRLVVCHRDDDTQQYSMNNLTIDSDGARFRLKLDGNRIDFHLSSAFNQGIVEDAALACITHYLMKKDITALKRIEEFEPLDSRGKVYQSKKGGTIISDAYNANPSSMRYAIDTLYNQKEPLKIACIGDMLELGDESAQYHYDIGKYLAEKRICLLITCGTYADSYRQGAIDGGMPASKVMIEHNLDEVQTLVNHYNTPGHAILIKGSHSTMFHTLKTE